MLSYGSKEWRWSIRWTFLNHRDQLRVRISRILKCWICSEQDQPECLLQEKVSLEEQEAQKEDRFLRGRQIAYMIYDYFRVIGAHGTVLDNADLFTISLRNVEVLEFDTRWDEIPLYDGLESLYKNTWVRSTQNCLRIVRLWNSLEDIETGLSKLKTMVKRSMDQKLRLRNFDAGNERIETACKTDTKNRSNLWITHTKR